MSVTNAQITNEITRLHDYFTNWFAGKTDGDSRSFDKYVRNHLAPEFVNIQPSGKMSNRDELLQQIQAGYGRNRAFCIRVGKVQIHQKLPGDIYLVTYEEYQRGAQNSRPENARLSTALLRLVGDGFEWLWVHETWLPQDQITSEMFDF